ncbi:EipB family protein, partial [Pseudomonadota bacterium]
MNFSLKRSLAYSLIGISLGAGALTASAAELVSHRAAYKIVLGQARDASPVSSATGQIGYGVEKVCGGWLSHQSGTMNLHLTTGDVVDQTMHYSVWEADNGEAFRFNVTDGAERADDVRGTAQMSADGGVANFTHPEAASFNLPPGTLFPVAHSQFMIDQAQAAQTLMESRLFEGADVEGAKLVVVFVSPLSAEARTVVKQVGGDLVARPGWTFRLAYYDPSSRTSEPLYEVEADILDNGVAPRWVLDYGD